jgi:hypothetical protein
MDLKWWEDMERILLAQDTAQEQAVVNILINLGGSKKGNFLTS